MKRWLLRLSIALITFALGYGIHFFSRTMFRSDEAGQVLPYCQVARNAEAYHDRNILVKAEVFVDSAGMVIYEDCDPVEALAAVVVSDENYPLATYVESFSPTPHRKTGQALIEGNFDAHATTGCWAPKFLIRAKRVELLSDLTDYIPPRSEGPALRIKH